MGLAIASLIVLLWGGHLAWALEHVPPDPGAPWAWLHMAVQAYLFTGLFITSHDAMHGTVSTRRRVNTVVGAVCAFLFAGLSWTRVLRNHHLHHAYPATAQDPDYCLRWRNPFLWWITFLLRYATFTQLAVMAGLFNLMMLRYSQPSLWMFWVIPSLLGSFQLFYFGTYRPHRLPHTESMRPHNARSQRRNHALAMISCYFFGYHHEHHESPHTPWWRLAQLRPVQEQPPPRG
jgi:beta-carotene/zeaxanthin 4-ketolase